MASQIEALREFIARRRAELRYSQVELAKHAGIPSSTIASIEAGLVTRAPRMDTLEKLARGLRVDVNVLIRISRGESINLQPEPSHDRLADLQAQALSATTPEEFAALEAQLKQLRQEAGLAPSKKLGLTKEQVILGLQGKTSPEYPYPPTEDEIAMVMGADELGIRVPVFEMPGFWDQPPADRRRAFRDLEGLIEETKRIQEKE